MSERTAPTNVSVAGTTLGTIISFAWESSKGVMPTTGYEVIYDAKRGIPLGGSPDRLDSSVLILTHFKTSVSGLQDLGDTSIVTIFSDNAIDLHEEWLSVAAANRQAGKRLWICQEFRDTGRRYFVPTFPSTRTFDAAEVNTSPDYTINLDVQGDEVVWHDDGTGTAANTYKEKIKSDISGFYSNYQNIPQYLELPESLPVGG